LVLEHLGPNLYGRRGHGGDGIFFVEELAGEEAGVAASPHNAAWSEWAAGPGRPQKLDMPVSRRREVTGTNASNQRGPQRVVQHRGEEAALDDPRWIQEPSVAVNATSIVPSSGLMETSSQPSVTAAAGSGILPSTASQNGPSRPTAYILAGTTGSTRLAHTQPWRTSRTPGPSAEVLFTGGG
jgi:hypothetical protein